MALSTEQVKGRIKNLAKQNNADARVLIRIYMMERFLERVAVSKYADNFVIKGGILVTSMVGVAMRSTMDIDTAIRNLNLSDEDARRIVGEIAAIDVGDDVDFCIKEVSQIMDEMEYPGIRIAMDAVMGMMTTPIKIDISTGDVITPRAVEYSYQLMLDDCPIKLWSYNLETVLAEKLQTVLVRGVLNTRMRDYYDIHALLSVYSEQLEPKVMKQAFHATCEKRSSLQLEKNGNDIIAVLAEDATLSEQWTAYQRKFAYASDIAYTDVIDSVTRLYAML